VKGKARAGQSGACLQQWHQKLRRWYEADGPPIFASRAYLKGFAPHIHVLYREVPFILNIIASSSAAGSYMLYNRIMKFTTPDICDEFLPHLQVLEPLFSDYGGKEKFCGEIVTIKCFEDNSLVKSTLGTDGSGKVLVVDGGGSLRCALLGDMLGAMAAENGWQGVVVNGCVRDVEILKNIDLGVRALNCHPLRSEKRNEGQRDLAVIFAGAEFIPGQYLYADENGIVVADHQLDLRV
jgi:regulator of ribonuclease activity A